MVPASAKQLEFKAVDKIEKLLDVEDDDGEPVGEPPEEICEFDRPCRKDAMDSCAICGEERSELLPAHERVLQIEFTEVYVVLCPKHEGELLRKLLNNYVKRTVKGSKVGYVGTLPKDAEASNGA